MLPDIDLGATRRLAVTCILERASISDSEAAGARASPPPVTSLMMDVPTRMRSPSLSCMLRTFSPFTKVPLVDPRS